MLGISLNLYIFCKYKILLNLPGHYPWSNRFKYLFLMDRIITINIDPETYYKDESWITFIDYLVKPNKHYIDLKFKYYRIDGITKNDKEYIKKCETNNANEYNKIIKKLQYIYNNQDKIKIDYDNFVKKLTMQHVYKYIYIIV